MRTLKNTACMNMVLTSCHQPRQEERRRCPHCVAGGQSLTHASMLQMRCMGPSVFRPACLSLPGPACLQWARGPVVLSVCRFVGVSFCESVGLSVCRRVGLSICRFVGVSVCWSLGLSVCRFVDLPVCCSVGLSVCRSVGLGRTPPP
jgi:hypothetical protein